VFIELKTDNKYQSLHNGYASGEFMPNDDTMAEIGELEMVFQADFSPFQRGESAIE
jgi:hypothetical protein